MAFCTQLEWDRAFPFDRYEAMTKSGGHDGLPQGCLARVVGRAKEDGAYVLEVWQSPDDARRFGESSAPLLKQFEMPMPTRTTAYETVVFETR